MLGFVFINRKVFSMQKVCVFESMLQKNNSGYNFSNIITSFHKSVSVIDTFKTNTHGLIKTKFYRHE